MIEKNRELIASLIFIVIGLFALFQDIRAGTLLIVVGFGVSSQVREWVVYGLKLLHSLITKEEIKEEIHQKQHAKEIYGGIQAKNIGKVEQKFTISESRKKRK